MINFPNKKYNIIYLDPPWKFDNKKTGGSMKSGSEIQYNVMSIEDIKKLPINDICADNCVMLMWWVASMPQEALDLLKQWEFKLKTMTGFDWVKLTKHGLKYFGMGFSTRQGSEHCLIAIKGKVDRINAGIRAVNEFENLKHSRKPQEFKKLIVDLYGDLPRIELFARQTEDDGWDYWGDEI